jgi:hypothetical protein
MLHSTVCAGCPAMPLSAEHLAVLAPLVPLLGQLAGFLLDFRSQPVSPKTTHAFEVGLTDLTRSLGQVALESTFNSLEPDEAEMVPPEIRLGGTRYRRRNKSPHAVDSTFGSIKLRRWLYEPRDAGERCLFPLHHLLGLVAGRATPALASRTGQLITEHTQREVQRILGCDHDVHWSQQQIRTVGEEVALIMSQQRQQTQADQLIGWLRQAWRGRGRFEPVLAVGRDGIMVPIRQDGYHEAAVATVSVYDRQGRRMGTVYLGWMPQAEQVELSRQLTALLQEVLWGWKGRRPRLAYITDGGWHPEEYYRGVLRKMADPGRAGEILVWQRVLDYYHATQYVTKLAEALFGAGLTGQNWARRMRGWLKQEGGLTRVLQSASYHRNERELRGKRLEAFWKAYNYLWKRRKHMDYARYRREGMPIGSGVTEAGCKVLVSQRLKRSGMGWGIEGGQVVLTLRSVWLSRVWHRAWNSHLSDSLNANLDTYERCLRHKPSVAA